MLVLIFFSARKAEKAQHIATDKNIRLQKEFAKNGIQWKVADAKAAGIHPLYALGANTMSFSPVSAGDGGAGYISQMGQDVSRAMYATANADQRAASQQSALALENMGLQNDLLRVQISKLSNQVGPALPSGVQSFPVDLILLSLVILWILNQVR